MTAICTTRGTCKSYDGVPVLVDIDLDFHAGEVHALAGENGAGKSTFIKILGGAIVADAGSMTLEGRPYRPASPAAAMRQGVGVIHQELSLVGCLSIADNLALANLDDPFLRRGRRESMAATVALRRVGLDIDPQTKVEDLPPAWRQTVEIARALMHDAKVLVFDEPTSALGAADVARLETLVHELVRSGVAVVWITHRMEEIERLADRVSVLRDGRRVASAAAADLPRDRLIRHMVGRELRDLFPPRSRPRTTTVLKVSSWSLEGTDRPRLDGLDFEIAAGEILGVAGVEGSGKGELASSLVGAHGGRTRGTIEVDGRRLPRLDPRGALAAGLVLVPGDRQSTGLVGDASVRDNIVLSSLDRHTPWALFRAARVAAAARQHVTRLGIRAAGLDADARTLSGGNQQKVLLARALEARPRVLLLEEPTRGIDIAARADVYGEIAACAAAGMAVLLVTSDLGELLGLAHRAVVLHRGRLAATLSGAALNAESVMDAALGAGIA